MCILVSHIFDLGLKQGLHRIVSYEPCFWGYSSDACYASRTYILACRPDGLACESCCTDYAMHIPNRYRMSLQSALIGFLLSKFLPKPITAQENVVLQTTAVATGTVSNI